MVVKPVVTQKSLPEAFESQRRPPEAPGPGTMGEQLQKEIITWMPYVSCFLFFIFSSGIAMGPYPIPHLMITELFLQSSRSSAYAVGEFARWFFIFVVAATCNLIEKHIGAYSFLIFWPFCVAGFFYILKVVPETKRKTFLEIRKLLEIYLVKKYLNVKPAAKKKPERHLAAPKSVIY